MLMLILLTCFPSREGFFSRKDSAGSQVTCNLSDTSSNSGIDANSNEQTEGSGLQMVQTARADQSEPDRGSDGLGISDDQNHIQGTIVENLDCEDSSSHSEGSQSWLLEIESRDCPSSSNVEMGRRHGSGQNIVGMADEDASNGLLQQNFQIEDTEHSNMQGFTDIHREDSELSIISNDDNGLSTHSDDMEGNMLDDGNRSESAALEGQQQGELIENGGADEHQSNVEWRNSAEESVDDNPLDGTASDWPQNILSNEDEGNSNLPEVPEIWQEDGGFQEAVENWLGGPSEHEVAPVGRIHGFYFPDDDNVNSVELRELLNRYVNIIGEFLQTPLYKIKILI